MAEEQPKTPSAEPSPQASAQASAAASEQTDEQPSEAPSWWQRLMGRRAPEPASTEQETPPDTKPSATRSVTEEELARLVQSETDRREAKRQAEQQAEARRKLRREDPYAYAEQDEQAEQRQTQSQQWVETFASLGRIHDEAVLDPIVHVLPKAEQERILALEGAGIGVDGRKLIVGEALKALEKHWKAEGAKDAEARLRKNPAFRKQVYGEFRGPEPEVVPVGGSAVSSPDGSVINDMLRAQLGIHRET
jgi:hypothetical protein